MLNTPWKINYDVRGFYTLTFKSKATAVIFPAELKRLNGLDLAHFFTDVLNSLQPDE